MTTSKIDCGFGYPDYDPCNNPKNHEFTDEQKRRLIAAYYVESVPVEDATQLVEHANEILSYYRMKVTQMDQKIKELEETRKHYETDCLPCDLNECRENGLKKGLITFFVSLVAYCVLCLA